MKISNSSKKDMVSLFLGIIAIHMYVISFAVGSIVLFVVTIIDALIAFILALKTDSDYGHAGLIIGLIVLLVSLITIVVI